MPIPKNDEIRIPALKLLKEKGALKLKDLVEMLADYFKLTDAEVAEMYPSGNGHIFYDRVTWALSYLHMAALVDKPNRGYYKPNVAGIKMLDSTPEKIHKYIEQKVSERETTKTTPTKTILGTDKTETSNDTPAEKLYISFEKIKAARKSEILETILRKSPYDFEKLVIRLLQRMGYGGEIKDSVY